MAGSGNFSRVMGNAEWAHAPDFPLFSQDGQRGLISHSTRAITHSTHDSPLSTVRALSCPPTPRLPMLTGVIGICYSSALRSLLGTGTYVHNIKTLKLYVLGLA